MKLETRKCLIAEAPFNTTLGHAAQDALDSDARQRAEIRDLKVRLAAAVRLADKHICRHESRHRGGVIWEICDFCGAKWADDKGGFKPSADAERLDAVADLKNKEWKR